MNSAPPRPSVAGHGLSEYQASTPAGAKREDIAGWFDVLDLDDHQSFGGKV